MSNAFYSFERWMRMWTPWPVPSSLTQPINPGWSFGNVFVNEGNSSAPGTEAAILAQESYGRQIGKLLDAVATLCEDRPDKGAPPFRDVLRLRDKVDEIKCGMAVARLAQYRTDLEMLREHRPAAFRTEMAALRSLFVNEKEADT